MKKIIFSIAFLLIFIGLTRAEQLRIAIMDLQSGSGVPEYFGADIAELIRTEMINLKKYIVLERSQMKEVLKEQEFQLSGCTETECAVQVGQLLSANKVLIGKVSKFGKVYTVNVRIVDVEKAIGEFAESITANSEDEIPNSIKILIQKLSARIKSTPSTEKEIKQEKEVEKEEIKTETESSKGGFRLRTASYIVTGLAIIPGIGWAKANNDLKHLYEDYKSLSPDETLSWDENRWNDEWQKIEDKKKTRNILASLTILTAGIGITMFLVDAIFLKPKTSSQALNDFEKNFLICSDYNKISIYYIKRF